MSKLPLVDELYCSEEKWDENDEIENKNNNNSVILEQDMFWENEEMEELFKKEKINIKFNNKNMEIIKARKEAIKWMVKVSSNYYGFNTLTSILSVDYFDKCMTKIPFIQLCKPWTIQLAAVTCLSLAAKVEETDVPCLLDLQVDGEKPIFEPKDIQKMELLVLSTLEWKMHPVTSLSFLNLIIRRLGLKNLLHWEFLNRCEEILLSLLPDWRFVSYLPSVLATATMMHVIDQIQPSNTLDYHTQLLNVLNINKEKVKDCYELIVEKSTMFNFNSKRKFEQMTTLDNNTTIIPSSPSGVIDANVFSSGSSNDSWVATSTNNVVEPFSPPSSVSSSVSSSPVIDRKKVRVFEEPMPLQMPSLSRVFVDFVESPR